MFSKKKRISLAFRLLEYGKLGTGRHIPHVNGVVDGARDEYGVIVRPR